MTRTLAAFLIATGLLLGPGAAWAQGLRIETDYLRIELNDAASAITGIAADPAGKRDFSHPLAVPAAPQLFGIFPACRDADGQLRAPQPASNRRLAAANHGFSSDGLRVGDSLLASFAVTVAPDKPELAIRLTLRAEADVTCRWAGLILAFDPALAPSSVYFAGAQGLAAANRGRLTAPDVAHAGAVCKHGAERTFALIFPRPTGVEVEVTPGRPTIAIAPRVGAEPIALRRGEAVSVEARLVFGLPRIVALKPVTSKFQPLAQDFIFWATQVATVRPFGERRMQETAAVIDPGLPPEIQRAYRFCWLRDVAHAWKSGVLVAGPDMLSVMRDEILAFCEKMNDAGLPPTWVTPEGGAGHGNLDSSGLLLGMIYDYLSRTGDVTLARALLPQADKMGEHILSLLGPRDLPVIGEGVDTYPDLGFIKGEQTYLTAVCCDGLRKLARLHEVIGDAQDAARWHTAANRIAFAANRPTDKGGLWDAERGVYVGWRNPDGSLRRSPESFANLWAISSGVCDNSQRIRSIFAHLNQNWQRYYLDGLCPTAHSVEPYANGLNQWVPWAGGWDVYLRARFSEPRAAEVWQLFAADYERTDFPYREASGYQQEAPNVGNRGRIWDSWGLLQAVYGGHYGIEMTPGHLRVLPRPLEYLPDDAVSGLMWRDATYDIVLRGRGLHLARVSLDGREWAACLAPPTPGKHFLEITASAGARRAFVMDAAPTVQLLGAAHTNRGLRIEAAAPCTGRYWFVIQWPDEWGAMMVESAAGAEFPQAAPLAGERAAVIVSVPDSGRFSLTLAPSPLGLTR